MQIYFEDKKLTNRLIAGDERAFRQFFDEYFSRLYRFALARVPDDSQAAADVVQATLSKALRKIHLYRGESALFTWLCVICRHEIAEWWKKQSRYQQHIVLTEDHPEVREIVESLDAPVADEPLSGYQRIETVRLIQVALDHLPSRYGDVLEWKYVEGCSVKDIAARLSLSYEATQSMLARAKQSFRDTFSTLVQPVIHLKNNTLE